MFFKKNIAFGNNPENINKIIKIQSHVRGMEMRDKIKLRIKPKNFKNKTPKKTQFIYENTISQKAENEDVEIQKKYNEIIVKYII